ncbi:MAG: hypothetical protein AB7I27_14190 [Bacteriovoracaceae bacterium]
MCLAILGCASKPKSFLELRGGYEQNKKTLELRDSFAFYHQGHEYYFAQRKFTERNKKCFYIVGFKDGKAVYQFPSSRFAELEMIYDEKATPEERINIVVSKLDQFQKEQEEKYCIAKSSISGDDIGYLVIFSPVLIFIAPMLYVKDLSNHVDDLFTNFDDMKLGMSFKEVKKIAGSRPLTSQEDNGRKVYFLDKANQRLVMYFKENKLHAWVRGYKPSGDNFPNYQRYR